MKRFVVTCIDMHGRKMTYRLTAPSSESVRAMARRRSWQIVAMEETTPLLALVFRLRPFSYKTLSLLFYQLGAMTRSGIPFVQACRLLLHDVTSKKQRQAMKLAVDYMEKGMAVSEALGQTGLFPSLVCRIVSAGERAGNLEQMLYLLGQYYEQADKQRRFLLDALSYPLFLMVCTTAMAVGIVAFILPVFEAMFEQMQMPLPAMTAYMLAGAHILQYYGAALAAGTVTGIASLFLLLRRPGVRRYTEDKLFSISVLRRLCVIFCWQRFSQMLAVQIRCGIPLLDALDDGAAVVPVDWFRRAVNQAARRLENGTSFSQAVRLGRFGTPYIETMLLVGETTGRYEDALQAVSEYYQWRIQSRLSVVRRLAGPLMLLVVGAVIGTLVISCMLPLLDMAAGMVP
ncbi:type II secretion system F family protein [uncultured Megasphaera sp.]|uniref:type II secretion system F family protein n=1 Tax=uncultured Megasphaera sp. TaxID=165188 RepID=UPI00265CC4C5|nr:type II secretion system F family protein [uncultured Megasphaera sp.]